MKRFIVFTGLLLFVLTSNAQPWSENFDSQTSNSYGTGSITINGRTWTRKDAGNFSYANSNMGSYAFTINDDIAGAHITTPALNTCGTVSFKYAYKNGNSSNVFKLQKSTDGTTFTTIDTRTLGASSNLTYVSYSYNVNESSSTLYIRILSDNQNAHLFIEDFSVTAYSSSNSNASDIIKKSGWSEPTSIAYGSYSAASSLTTSNSLEVAAFTIRDGGTTTDADALGTTLTDLSVDVTNWDNLKALAIFDGSTNVTEVTSITSGTVSFTGLSLAASDGGTKDFTLRATFSSTVTDNDNIKYAISSVTADASGSNFASSDGGGAATDNSGNNNKIVVTADRLAFTSGKPGSSVFKSQDFDVEVEATDANGNRDIDASNSISLAKASGTGTLSSTIGLSQSLTSGIYTWTDVQYDTEEDFTITVTASGSPSLSSVTSGTITCQDIPDLIISEIADPGDNSNARFVELYNASSSAIDFSTTTFYLCRQANGSTWGDIQLSGSVASGATYVVAYNSSDHQSAYSKTPEKTSGYISGNGDDGYFLYYGGNHSSGTLVDAYGVIDEDGTGKSWEYEDSRAVRKSNSKSSGASKGSSSWNSGDWSITSADVADMTPGVVDGDQNLPVTYISFTAVVESENVLLKWQTASEENNDYFTLERSYDALNFIEVDRIQGAGNSNIVNNYKYIDNVTGSNTVIYYRLKQTNFDGSYMYSKVISINLNNHSDFIFDKVWAVEDGINLMINSAGKSQAKVEILSIDGRMIGAYNLSLSPDIVSYKVFVGGKLEGVYIVRLISGDKTIIKKLIL
jgi:hypothetical protein